MVTVDPAKKKIISQARVLAQIEAIEADTLMNRGSREGWITLIRKEAMGAGITEAQLMDPVAGNSFFQKLIEVDAQIKVLRKLLK